MSSTLRAAIAAFGSSVKAKLANLAAVGEPEDQLRAPLEQLVADIAEICGLHRTAVAMVGETALSELKTRPDYAVTVRNALVGFIEVKAPGKGADPRRFRDRHDKQQWEKLQSLPNPKGDPDAWLYFYENFLEVYDNNLRKQTGSYYTPPEVVGAMVRLVDETLRSPARFNLNVGLASPAVMVADPAIGTGTFLLGILRRIAETVAADEGPGAVAAAMDAATRRLVGFELQFGPFAVAQLRLLGELAELMGTPPTTPLRMFVTDTLGNPYIEQEWFPAMLGPIADSRRQANEIKRETPITVVIGNPPYKEKAKGRGGWVESGSRNSPEPAPLAAWMPPPKWGVGAHAKHLRNLYIYFWRWATWKVFDHHPNDNTGIVCFITVAGFLNGPGFQKMRDYLRRAADEIWIIDCSPEGHQPEVSTRIFEGVQQPVCIVLASRSPDTDDAVPAKVRYWTLPAGHRRAKFEALADLSLDADGWAVCSIDWRAPFLPQSEGAWATYPALDDLFLDSGSGVMPGRTWVIAPDAESLLRRWQKLIDAPADQKEALFHPHLRGGQPGDRHSRRVVPEGLSGYEPRPLPIVNDQGACAPPVRYGFRSFDQQWIIPDKRLINQPNPTLWEGHSAHQVYLTAPTRTSPSAGPALTFTALIPDLDHYNGRGGRAFPLWSDRAATVPNVSPKLLAYLSQRYGQPVSAGEVMAYIAAVAAHPAFTARFLPDLVKPGLRIPLTADGDIFATASELGRVVIWLHTFGECFADAGRDRPAGAPRLPKSSAPLIPLAGTISQHPAEMPDSIDYDAGNRRLLIGRGYVEGVPPQVWNYEVSGKQVLRQWFSYRKANRERPIIGDRRPPSALGNIQPDHWLAEYTTELINLLHVLGRLIDLEPSQASLLEQICAAPTISADDLRAAGALEKPASLKRAPSSTDAQEQMDLLDI